VFLCKLYVRITGTMCLHRILVQGRASEHHAFTTFTCSEIRYPTARPAALPNRKISHVGDVSRRAAA